MKPITIGNYQKGIAPSAYLGFQEFRGLNITSKPGVVFPNYALTKESSTTITDLIIDSCVDNQGQIWACSAAKLYRRTLGGVWSSAALPTAGASGTLYGLNFWGATTSDGGNKPYGFIFLFAGQSIDLLDLTLVGAATAPEAADWSKGWTSLSGEAVVRRSFVASNNVLYYGLGANKNIGGIAEVTYNEFDGTTGEVTIGTAASPTLKLLKDFRVQAFEELGTKLLICGQLVGSDDSAMLIAWDKASADFETPIIKFNADGDSAGWQIITVGARTYVHVGKTGQWWITNGTIAEEFAQMPVTLTDLAPGSTILYPKAVAVVNGLIYFGMSTDGTQYGMGVYSLNIKTRAINLEHLISTGGDGTSFQAHITTLTSLGNKDFVTTWREGTTPTFGADSVDTNRYTSDLAYFISEFYQPGLEAVKAGFQRPEIRLSKPLASGDSIKVWYRTSQNEAWTTYGDPWFTNSDVGYKGGVMKTISDISTIQFKVALNKSTELMPIILI